MEPVQDTVTDYYNKSRKRSFLYSRITVITSMFVLVIALSINISLLYSHHNSTIQSHAESVENPQKNLPALPSGCSYQQTKRGLAVVCPPATPTVAVTVPINIALPALPPQCHFDTMTGGNKIICSTLSAPIPTVPVTLPTTCTVTNQPNTVTCSDSQNKNVSVPLPSLPGGCSYQKVANKYFVVCKAK